jgi:ubiquinone/menaquinone biosynthesis C-methylase UbiE
VAAGGGDIGDALTKKRKAQVTSLDINPRGLKLTRLTVPVVGDALALPFRDREFDAVICSLSFHHLSDVECVQVLKEMWRTTSALVLVNDLHRHRVAYASIRLLSRLFSHSVMVKHDGPVSVRRAFRPLELENLARRAGIRATVHRSFPYRLVLVAEK